MRYYAFRLDSGNLLVRNSSKDFSFSSRQYCSALTSHRYRPSSTKRVSRSASDLRSQARISSILVTTNRARLRLSLGNMGGILVRSGCPRQLDVRTAGAGILGEADATVGQRLGGFDPSDR